MVELKQLEWRLVSLGFQRVEDEKKLGVGFAIGEDGACFPHQHVHVHAKLKKQHFYNFVFVFN